jgi:NADH dehydrogenase FAD-containing subunit
MGWLVGAVGIEPTTFGLKELSQKIYNLLTARTLQRIRDSLYHRFSDANRASGFSVGSESLSSYEQKLQPEARAIIRS